MAGKIWGGGLNLSYRYANNSLIVSSLDGQELDIYDSKSMRLGVFGFHRYNLVDQNQVKVFVQPTPYFEYDRSEIIGFDTVSHTYTLGISGAVGATIDLSDRVRGVLQATLANVYLYTFDDFDTIHHTIELTNRTSGVQVGVEVRL
jgi:hypothetical protein